MEILIRKVKDSDYQQIAEIYNDREVIAQTTQLIFTDAEHWKNFYRSRSTQAVELVAVVDNRVVGHLGILPNVAPRKKHICSFGLAVHSNYQNMGVGKKLMEVLIDLSDNWLNISKIQLTVFTDNEVAISLYKKFGFVEEGILKYDTFKNGKYADALLMARYHPKLLQ